MSNKPGEDRTDRLRLRAWEAKKSRTPLQDEVLRRLRECKTKISELIGQGEAATARLESWRYTAAAGLTIDRQWEQALAVLTAESAPCPPAEELQSTPELRILQGGQKPGPSRKKKRRPKKP